jgi:hypothetical protein
VLGVCYITVLKTVRTLSCGHLQSGTSYLPASAASNSLDLSGWTNLLENGRGNGGGGFVKSELNSSPWEQMLAEVTTPQTRRSLLQNAGLPTGLGQSPLGREASQQIGPDTTPKGKGIVDALSPRNLGREPQSALEADLRDVSEKIVLKEAEEKAQVIWSHFQLLPFDLFDISHDKRDLFCIWRDREDMSHVVHTY